MVRKSVIIVAFAAVALLAPALADVDDGHARRLGSCPAGQYSGTGSTPCMACPAGKFQSRTGKTSCDDCAAGTSTGGGTGKTSCTACAPGTYAASTGSATCTACPAGSKQDDAGSNHCDTCQPGTFQSATGKTKCDACPAGSYSNAPGATSCTLCAIGTYEDDTGSTSCNACPRGKYQSATGKTKCESCPAGSYAGSTGSSACTSCPVGTYQDDTGKDHCDQCKKGRYQDQTGKTRCNTCPAGTYSGLGADHCTPCPAGTSQDDTGSESCEACRPSTYQHSTGQTECLHCNRFGTSHSSGSGLAQCVCDAEHANCGTVYDCSVHTHRDPLNCGACGNVCTANLHHTSGATPTCSDSLCHYDVAHCVSPWKNCNGLDSDGCESDLTDINNCGTCGHDCSPAALHAVTTGCTSGTGTCTFSGCQAGYTDCTTSDGCETHTAVDPANCGACSFNCAADMHHTLGAGPVGGAAPTCAAGVCQYTGACADGWKDCDGLASNGCETNLASVDTCGSCTNDCDAPSMHVIGASCVAGECAHTACESGYSSCDGDDADGCEVNIGGSDAENCGSCSQSCAPNPAHTFAECSAGACVPGGDSSECEEPWATCTPASPCAVNLQNDANNCGDCGVVCSTELGVVAGSVACLGGECKRVTPLPLVCLALRWDCNGLADDGCEFSGVSCPP